MSPLPQIGHFALALALAAALYAATASAAGARWGVPQLSESGRRAYLAAALLATAATAILVQALLAHDFSLRYVWQTTARTTPPVYRLAALWSGQAGSLLFWCWLLAVQGALAIRRPKPAIAGLVPWLTAVNAATIAFFLALVVFVANPFDRLPAQPLDGNGLNPLLQHPQMVLHPPALYLGFTGLTIPYGLAVAALVTGRVDSLWIHAGRRWLLAAWLWLTLGLALGGRWAYDVLGWGGYWGWDPVENAGLLPWLAATALLHSANAQQRRGLFPLWNMVLVSMLFWLVLLGTFLTRGGLVSSVHAFAQSAVGPYFLSYIIAVTALTLLLLWRRLPELAAGPPLTTVGGREVAYLITNVLFMSALFAVLWGTLLPIVAEIAGGQRVSVGPPYYHAIAVPMLWLILLGMALCPLTAWAHVSWRQLWRSAAVPVVLGLGIGVALVAGGMREPVVLLAAAPAALALAVAACELGRRLRHLAPGARALGPQPLWRLTGIGRSLGGHVVHLGVAVLAIGLVATNLLDTTVDLALRPGEKASVGPYEFTYRGLKQVDHADRTSVLGVLDVTRRGRPIGQLLPARQVVIGWEHQSLAVPAILHRPGEDVYAVMRSYEPDTQVLELRLMLVPLAAAMWFGVALIVLGGLLAVWGPSGQAANAVSRRLSACGATGSR